MRKYIFLFLISTIAVNMYSQKIGQWNTLFSYEENLQAVIQTEDGVFAVSDGKLFKYDPSDESIETYSKTNGTSITNISYSQKYKSLIIVREDGDIDLLYSQAKYTNISGLKDVIENIDKTVNNIYVYDDYAYLSTNFGLFVINLKKEEVKESIIVRYPFYTTAIYNGKLYAVTSKGVIRTDLNSNIQNIGGWEQVSLSSAYSGSNYLFSDTEIRQLMDFDNKLVFIVPGRAFYSYDETIVNKIDLEWENPYTMTKRGSALTITQYYGFTVLNDLNSKTYIHTPDWVNKNYVNQDKDNANTFWLAIPNKNLSSIKINTEDKTFELTKSGIKPIGPLSNYPYFMSFESDKLIVTGGKVGGDNYWFPGRLSEFGNNKWYNYDKTAIDEATGAESFDYVSAAVDPFDAEHIFVCSWGPGILEFKNKECIKLYNNLNSPLSVVNGTNVRTNGARFDSQGNFWALNRHTNQPIKVIKKGTSTLLSLDYPALYDISTRETAIMIDKYNNKWISTCGGTPYIFIINENGTIENTADDKTKLTTNFYSQDGDKLSIGDLFVLKEDLNGNIWVGTNIGLYVIYNSSQIFSKDLILNKIKIPRNDGTNTADILLDGVSIRCMAIDGGNRKWIGTLAGLYLVSANGQETIQHFTMENSILPSNSIISLAIDNKTGVVYIGTEAGIVSYKGEAIEGAESYSNVYAFPNPVDPDYQGAVTITGLMSNSTVKITDVKGNLINQGTSIGGQYIWNGKNVKKERVETGVYLVFGSTEDGKSGVVTKVMVVTN